MSASFDPASYLVEAYQGEVLGEALFALMAERESDAEQVPKWRELERLERHVKARLRPILEQRGLATAGDLDQHARGRGIAIALSPLPWPERMRALRDGVQGYVDGFRAADAAAPEGLRDCTRFVLAHEEALLAFFERELAGDGPKSLEAVSAFLAATDAPEEAPLPEGIQLMPLDPVFRADPNAAYAALRQRAPVHRDRQTDRVVLTRHDDVVSVIRDLTLWSDPRKSLPNDPVRIFVRDLEEEEPSMLFLDDPAHKRLRKLVSSAFTPRAVERARPLVRQVAVDLVDAIEKSDAAELELMEALASPLPAIAIAQLLGVDPAQQADFKAWSEASTEAFFNPFASEEQREASARAQDALNACFEGEIARRHREPSDDLIGKMVQAEEEGDRLSEEEVVTMCNLLLIAGNVTTTDLIGNGMRALLEHPDQLARLRARPELLANAVEEMLRFDPPVTTTGRIASRDLEIGDVPVRKGESMTCLLAAANRDPAVYPDADRFDIERADTHHNSFGGGAHLCVGAHLARVEAQEAIGALVARFPRLRASERGFELKQVPGFRGLAHYWVRLD